MKKLILLCLMLLLFRATYAPETGIFILMEEAPIMNESHLWLEAIAEVESGKGQITYNPNEPLAAGKLQQYPIFVKDVNRILGYEKYTLADRLDDKKAEEMFWIYQNYYNPEMNFEKMCRIQCGGPDGHKQSCTTDYYNLVKTKLNA